MAEIATLCRDAGLERASSLNGPAGGLRRSELALHLQALDLADERDARKLLVLIESALEEIDAALAAIEDFQDVNAGEREDALRGYRAEVLRQLGRDGYEYVAGQVRSKNTGAGLATIATHAATVDLPYLREQIARLQTAVDVDPWLAIGTAKELVETVCKTVLRDRGIEVGKDWEVPELVKAVRKELRLVPEDVPNGHRAAKTIKTLMSNLGTVAQGLAELRNPFGTGHGADGRAKGLEPRHARLAVGAAATLATFLLETHLARPAVRVDAPEPRSVRSTEVTSAE